MKEDFDVGTWVELVDGRCCLVTALSVIASLAGAISAAEVQTDDGVWIIVPLDRLKPVAEED